MRLLFLVCVASVLLVGIASAGSINGQYLEVRNSNMWAGPCLANAEIGIVGQRAMLAWKVTEGTYDNVRLDGLAIVAVVFGDATFGVAEKVNTRTVFVVDERADESQKAALIRMATALAGDTIQEVIATKQIKVKLEIGKGEASGYALLDAGIAKIRTRRMRASDNTCGTRQRMAYPVLSKVSDERAAYTLHNQYLGKEFDVNFVHRDLRSGVIAKFAL